jgi:hypothetical protein
MCRFIGCRNDLCPGGDGQIESRGRTVDIPQKNPGQISREVLFTAQRLDDDLPRTEKMHTGIPDTRDRVILPEGSQQRVRVLEKIIRENHSRILGKDGGSGQFQLIFHSSPTRP